MNDQANAAGGDHWFRKGSEAIQARQWDYAVECFCNAVRLQPDSLHYRQAKHRSCRRRLRSERSTAAGHLSSRSVRLVDIRRKLLQAKLRNDWAAVDRHAEEGLTYAPADPQFYACVAAAAVERQYPDIARYAWSMALKHDRRNETLNKDYGRFLATQRDFDNAEKCFKRVLAVQPSDRYASEMLRYIDVERLIDQGRRNGLQKTAAATDKTPAAEPPVLPPQLGSPGLAEAQQISIPSNRPSAAGAAQEKTVAAGSRRRSDLLKLARLCAGQREWDRSAAAFQELLKLTPEDPHLIEEYEDVQLARLRNDLEQMQRAARRNPASQLLQQQAAELQCRLVERRVEVFERRIQQYPTDLNLRFTLAEDYSQLGQYALAIPLYQQACQHPTLRERSLLKLGQCWICDGKRDLASKQFALALKALSPKTHPVGWKTAHYWMGRIAESDGHPDQAISHYAEVLLLDYDFRDTVSRLETLQPTTPPDTSSRTAAARIATTRS